MNGSQALEAAADAPQLKGLVKDKRWLWHEFRSCSFFEASSQHEMSRRFFSARSRVGSCRSFSRVPGSGTKKARPSSTPEERLAQLQSEAFGGLLGCCQGT